MKLRRIAEFLVLRSLICFIQIIPIEWCSTLAAKLAWVFNDLMGFRRRVIEENIRVVYPRLEPHEVRAMSRKMWYHLILMGCEVTQAPRKIHLTNWRKYVDLHGSELMTASLVDYRPLVAVSGHYGNFEMGGFLTGLFGTPCYTVARKLDNPYLDEFINDFRGLNGQFILPKNGSAGQVQDVLDQGGVLALLGDQHAGNKGCWIDFLGRPASCHKALALFTLTGNAPMMVTYCRQTEKPLHFELGCQGFVDPMEIPDQLASVRKLTQWYNNCLAEIIHAEPEQYWWLHRRWKEKSARVTDSPRRTAA